MKKVLMTIALVCLATASFGYISVNWDAAKVYDYQATTSDKKIATANADTTQILWQLVYTTASSAAAPVLDEKSGDVSYQSGDKILATRLWDAGTPTQMSLEEYVSDESTTTSTLAFNATKGYITTTGGAVYKNETFNPGAGQVYQAIFQYLENGNVYYSITDLTAPSTDSMLAPANVGTWPTKGVYISNLLGTVETPTEVPEPATMGLLGLGALAMVIRRKLRK